MKEIDIARRDIQLYKIIFLFNLQCECFKQNYLNISTLILTRPLFSPTWYISVWNRHNDKTRVQRTRIINFVPRRSHASARILLNRISFARAPLRAASILPFLTLSRDKEKNEEKPQASSSSCSHQISIFKAWLHVEGTCTMKQWNEIQGLSYNKYRHTFLSRVFPFIKTKYIYFCKVIEWIRKYK